MKSDFLTAINQLATEKGISKEAIVSAIEAALISAYKRNVANTTHQKVSVRLSPQTGEARVFAEKTVVDTVTDDATQNTLSAAQQLEADPQLGAVVHVETTPRNFGRIAAQTAKQVVVQKLREAERDMVYDEFVDRVGDIVTGVVSRPDPRGLLLEIGKAEAILPQSEQVMGEHYRPGSRLRVYLIEIERSPRGPALIVSRAHKNLLKRLLEIEVPEIHNGVVEIKAIARQAGSRSKVAVWARQEGVDPVGSCVGVRGVRIQNIVNELNGEKIDVAPWHPDPAVFVANALSPAQVISVDINEAERTATVVVPDRVLSLAIGKEGQNARLAAYLTGLRIDIKPGIGVPVGPTVARAPVGELVGAAAPGAGLVPPVGPPGRGRGRGDRGREDDARGRVRARRRPHQVVEEEDDEE